MPVLKETVEKMFIGVKHRTLIFDIDEKTGELLILEPFFIGSPGTRLYLVRCRNPAPMFWNCVPYKSFEKLP